MVVIFQGWANIECKLTQDEINGQKVIQSHYTDAKMHKLKCINKIRCVVCEKIACKLSKI